MEITIKDYNKKLRGNLILSDISATFSSGKIWGIVGTNGSGKTMLLRAIAGLILPDSGSITIDGKVLGDTLSFPENMGLLLEYPSFISSYSGFKNLKMIADINKKIDTERIRECMSRLGLNPDEKKAFRKYSLGMKQKLGIACAIMENPDLLILDEPFNALDEKSINIVKDIIREFKADNKLVIMTCHDSDNINSMADYIYEMYEGAIIGTRDLKG